MPRRTWTTGLLLAAAILAPGRVPAEDGATQTRIQGEVLHANTLEFGILAVRDVVATPAMAGQVLSFDPCSGTTYGGRVSGRIAVDLATGGYRMRFELAGADLASFLRQFRGNPANLGGQVAGWIELEIPEARSDRMTGRGELHIANANLVHLPLLTNLLLGDPTGARNQDALDASFTVGNGQVVLGDTVLRSPSATIGFAGRIGLDGELAIELTPDLRLKVFETATFSTINRILAPIGRSAARAVLVGQVTNPVLVMDPFGLGGKP